MPDLGNLVDGDLNYTTDFKQVYATILNKWLAADDAFILNGKFEQLHFI
jgi:uncharacterized protein (DUF1501 family)